MTINNADMTEDEKMLQTEIEIARGLVEVHKKAMDKALESLQQLARGKISLIQFTDLKNAIGSFTPAKLAVEKAKRVIKAKLHDELKG